MVFMNFKRTLTIQGADWPVQMIELSSVMYLALDW